MQRAADSAVIFNVTERIKIDVHTHPCFQQLTSLKILKKSRSAYRTSSIFCSLCWLMAHMALRTPWRPMRLGKRRNLSSKAWLQAMSFSCRSGTPKANWEGGGGINGGGKVGIFFKESQRESKRKFFQQASPVQLVVLR